MVPLSRGHLATDLLPHQQVDLQITKLQNAMVSSAQGRSGPKINSAGRLALHLLVGYNQILQDNCALLASLFYPCVNAVLAEMNKTLVCLLFYK